MLFIGLHLIIHMEMDFQTYDEIEIFVPNKFEATYIKLIQQYGKVIDNMQDIIDTLRYRLRMRFT